VKQGDYDLYRWQSQLALQRWMGYFIDIKTSAMLKIMDCAQVEMKVLEKLDELHREIKVCVN